MRSDFDHRAQRYVNEVLLNHWGGARGVEKGLTMLIYTGKLRFFAAFSLAVIHLDILITHRSNMFQEAARSAAIGAV